MKIPRKPVTFILLTLFFWVFLMLIEQPRYDLVSWLGARSVVKDYYNKHGVRRVQFETSELKKGQWIFTYKGRTQDYDVSVSADGNQVSDALEPSRN